MSVRYDLSFNNKLFNEIVLLGFYLNWEQLRRIYFVCKKRKPSGFPVDLN